MHRRLVAFLLFALLLVGYSAETGCKQNADPQTATAKPKVSGAGEAGKQEATPPANPQDSTAGNKRIAPAVPNQAAVSNSAGAVEAVPGAEVDDTKAGLSAESGAMNDAQRISKVAATPQPLWSTRRLVLLAPGGPRIIDVRVNIAGDELAAAFERTTQSLAKELEFDFDAPITWEALLDKPLVQSGWLGNLVPTAEQRAELLSMYDKENAGLVDIAEFEAFLTRGMSRRDHIRLVHARANASGARWPSPWGPLDQDQDGQLSEEERKLTHDALMHFDFDGDGLISDQEVMSTTDEIAAATNMTRSSGLLNVSLVHTPSVKEPAALERAIHDYYTFSDAIPRDAFFAWDDSHWGELDRDAKGQIGKRDLKPLEVIKADAQLDFALPYLLGPEASDAGDQPTGPAALSASRDESQCVWTPGTTGGRLLLPGCIVLVQVRDDHGPLVRRVASEQFSKAVDDAQIASVLTNTLGLKEGAFQLLGENLDQRGSRAWHWVVAPRHYHVTVNWTSVEAPWSELIDANGDRRLSTLEVSDFCATASRWDRNINGKLEEEELPLVVSLTVARDDERLANFRLGGMPAENGGKTAPQGPSWFTGMDYNSDGELTHAEFLGEDEAFRALDTNGDGIIDAREVYAPH